MDETKIYVTAMSIAGTVILGLIAAVWSMVRTEASKNADALEMKASHEALKDAKSDFMMRLDKQHTEFQQRLREVSERQDREIDWLKDEMDKISSNIAEMRRENTQANTAILARLQELALAVGSKK